MENFYEKNSKEYIEKTIHSDMKQHYRRFERYLMPSAKKILDLGFGSGRDLLHFQKRYDVYGIDNCEAFCLNAQKMGFSNIFCMEIEAMNFEEEFDGIWACASLLHIPSIKLKNVFMRCYNALKKNGIFYCTFKYGDFEGIRDGRYYIDLTENTFREFIKDLKFEIIYIYTSQDINGREVSWLNVILKKKI